MPMQKLCHVFLSHQFPYYFLCKAHTLQNNFLQLLFRHNLNTTAQKCANFDTHFTVRTKYTSPVFYNKIVYVIFTLYIRKSPRICRTRLLIQMANLFGNYCNCESSDSSTTTRNDQQQKKKIKEKRNRSNIMEFEKR